MGHIELKVDEAKSFARYTATGAVTSEDIQAIIRIVIEAKLVFRYELWDFSQADVSAISAEDVRRILSLVARHIEAQPGEKTAMVHGRDFAFGMGRMYELLTEAHDFPVKHRAFRSVDAAMAWLLDNGS